MPENNSPPAPDGATLPDPIEAELHAMRVVWAALANLDPATRARVLAWVAQHTERASVGDVSLDSPVEMLGFPRALMSRLDNVRVDTVGDLVVFSICDLRRARGIGQVFIALIQDRLAAAGFALAEASPS